MTHVERYGLQVLDDFVADADEMGICFGGAYIDEDVQQMVIDILKDYISKYRFDSKEVKEDGR